MEHSAALSKKYGKLLEENYIVLLLWPVSMHSFSSPSPPPFVVVCLTVISEVGDRKRENATNVL